MTTVSFKAEHDTNLFQRNLIPADALYVRYAMMKAAEFAKDERLFFAHTLPTAFAVAAIVMTFFNAVSYLLQIPFKIGNSIVCFRPVDVVKELVQGVTNVGRSLMYIPLAVAFIAGGIFLPDLIYSNFSPDFCKDSETRCNELLLKYEKALKEKEAKISELEKKVVETQAALSKLL